MGVVITGSTIYVLNNPRHQVEQVDIIELVLAVQERCLATQTSTNPTYNVDPISYVSYYKDTNYFIPGLLKPGHAPAYFHICYTTYWPDATARVVSYTNSVVWRAVDRYWQSELYYAKSWTSNDGYTWVTQHVWESLGYYAWTNQQSVTNLIGWYPDRALMATLDVKIKELATNYVDASTVYDGTTNIVMNTFTGLLTSLNLGDGTNFTRTPCWTNNVGETNCTTNAATYGDYPWQIYVEDLQERYKVLEALKMTRDTYSTSVSGGVRNVSIEITDPEIARGQTTNGTWVDHWNINAWMGYALGNYDPAPASNITYSVKTLTWSEVKTIAEWGWYYGTVATETPTNIIITNYTTTGLAAGYETKADVYVGTTSSNPPVVKQWVHYVTINKQYATLRWLGGFTNSGISNSVEVFTKMPTSRYTLSTESVPPPPTTIWSYPRSWVSLHDGGYSHDAWKIVSHNQSDGTVEVEYRTATPIGTSGTFPSWCDAPSKGAGVYDNSGAVGQVRNYWITLGPLTPPLTIPARTWQFNYCANKYW